MGPATVSCRERGQVATEIVVAGHGGHNRPVATQALEDVQLGVKGSSLASRLAQGDVDLCSLLGGKVVHNCTCQR